MEAIYVHILLLTRLAIRSPLTSQRKRLTPISMNSWHLMYGSHLYISMRLPVKISPPGLSFSDLTLTMVITSQPMYNSLLLVIQSWS